MRTAQRDHQMPGNPVNRRTVCAHLLYAAIPHPFAKIHLREEVVWIFGRLPCAIKILQIMQIALSQRITERAERNEQERERADQQKDDERVIFVPMRRLQDVADARADISASKTRCRPCATDSSTRA